MSTFNIENLLPNAKYSFQLSKTLAEEEISYSLDLSVPKYATRMDKVQLSFKKVSTVPRPTQVANSASFYITKYAVQSKDNNNKSTVRFFVNSTNYSTLAAKDKIFFSTNSASALKDFNTSSAIVNSVSFGTSQKYIDVVNMVSSSFTPSSSGNAGSTQTYPSPYTNYFIEVNKITNYDTYAIYIDNGNDFRNQLMWNDYVRDIIIFAQAYADTSAVPADSLKKKIVYLDTDVDDNQPPTYASIVDYFGKKSLISITEIWSTAPSGTRYFWAAVARYKKINGAWVGQWLHVDENKKPIWTDKAKDMGK